MRGTHDRKELVNSQSSAISAVGLLSGHTQAVLLNFTCGLRKRHLCFLLNNKRAKRISAETVTAITPGQIREDDK